jgi:hypothetical protein
VLVLWAAIVLGFFTFSARQEYYSLPALPALALLLGGFLARAESDTAARLSLLRWSRWLLVPAATAIALVCAWFAFRAPQPAAGVTLDQVLSANPEMYNLSLGHVFDLTESAMGFFRVPLFAVAVGMATLGLGSHLLRRTGRSLASNLTIAAGTCVVLLAAHEGLVRFNPILGSKDLALAIRADGLRAPVLIDGELTAGSSLLFYLDNPVLLVNGRINGPWFGSFWPDARPIFLDDAGLAEMWRARTNLYLMTYHPEQRVAQLCKLGPVVQIAESGGKTVLRNTQPSATEQAKIAGVNRCH